MNPDNPNFRTIEDWQKKCEELGELNRDLRAQLQAMTELAAENDEDAGKAQDTVEDLTVKLDRTVDAAYHALLAITAWMGIPESRREAMIEEQMSNVRFCAKNDMRRHDLDVITKKLEDVTRERDDLNEFLHAARAKIKAKHEDICHDIGDLQEQLVELKDAIGGNICGYCWNKMYTEGYPCENDLLKEENERLRQALNLAKGQRNCLNESINATSEVCMDDDTAVQECDAAIEEILKPKIGTTVCKHATPTDQKCVLCEMERA